jgi:AcrR family transcriptional regulator
VPRLWTETLDEHRRAVRDAIIETTVALVGTHGLRAVTMSQIAEETGIGRATLYKYFPDVEAILVAWHQQQIAGHLEQLAYARDRQSEPVRRLEAVLETYALLSHGSRGLHDSELAAFLHRDDQVGHARHRVREMVSELVADGVVAGQIRNDVPPGELASYCLHALTAAASLSSKGAVRRLVVVTLDALRPSS